MKVHHSLLALGRRLGTAAARAFTPRLHPPELSATRAPTRAQTLLRTATPGGAVLLLIAATAPLSATVIAAGAVAASEVRVAAKPAATPARQPAAASAVLRHADAVQSFQEQRYAEAYGRFAELADGGHAASALMALAMVCHGTSVFGTAWSATPGQIERWSRLAAIEVGQRGPMIAEHDRGE